MEDSTYILYICACVNIINMQSDKQTLCHTFGSGNKITFMTNGCIIRSVQALSPVYINQVYAPCSAHWLITQSRLKKSYKTQLKLAHLLKHLPNCNFLENAQNLITLMGKVLERGNYLD